MQANLFRRVKNIYHHLRWRFSRPLKRLSMQMLEGRYCDHPHMSSLEAKFRNKHGGHVLQTREEPDGSGIGTVIFIRCHSCDTNWIDVTDVGTW